MMALQTKPWYETLVVAGKMSREVPMRRHSWFRTGGVTAYYFEPLDDSDLAAFLRQVPPDIEILTVGVGSNLLVRDAGFSGVVIRLVGYFQEVSVVGTMVIARAGAMDVHIARAAQEAGLAGLEFLVGIPGTIGGAAAMNAGAYGRDMADVVRGARAFDRSGARIDLTLSDFHYAYRSSAVGRDLIIAEVFLHGEPDRKAVIQRRMDKIIKERGEAQPTGMRTGGSTFKNPPREKAWALIDRAGCRGLRVGDAEISSKHCNFIINHGGASATDIEELGEMVRRRVHRETGVLLDWEIRRVGMAGARGGHND